MFRTSTLFVISSVALLGAAPRQEQLHSLDTLVFEPNQGQAPADVEWLAHGRNFQLLFGEEGATMVLANPGDVLRNGRFSLPASEPSPAPARAGEVRMRLKGSSVWQGLTGLQPTGGYSNYFLGNDPAAWRTHVPHYSGVKVPQVYPGIDVLFYSDNGELEYDFQVSAGSDPGQIRLAFDGIDRMRVDPRGDLLLTTAEGAELRHHLPKIYQTDGNRTVEVAGAYQILDRGLATFALAAFDRHKPLVIDPTLDYTTYLAGNNQDFASGIAVDASGNAYITGYTVSSQFPFPLAVRCAGGVCPTHTTPPIAHGFMAKVSPTGSLLFLTYLGGNSVDLGTAIAVDSTGVYVTGTTQSFNFPTKNYFHPFNGSGAFDVFVTKLNLAGDTLIYSTFLGGSDIDTAYALAVDSSHAAYVGGITYSCDFEPLVNPLQNTCGGGHDAFVAKVNAAGSYVDYSTYLGGSDYDEIKGMAVDSAGAAYVTGDTYSSNFPGAVPTPGVGSPNGNFGSAFVTKLSSSGTSLVYSTYLGHGSDVGLSIAVDGGNNAYVAGLTASTVFPTTPGAFETSAPVPGLFDHHGFAAKLSASGGLLAATYVTGGDGDTGAEAVAFNRAGEVYVGGYTSSTSFPGAAPIPPNPTSGFLVKLSPQLSALSYTSLVNAEIHGIVVTQPFSIFVTTYPTIYTAGIKYTGGTSVTNIDSFVTKLDERPNTTTSTGSVGTFELSPAVTAVGPNEPVTYIIKWTTPGPWRTLNTIELRAQGEDERQSIFSLRFEEATNSFSILDADTGQFGIRVTPGQPGVLENRYATLYVDQSAVQGSGPTGHTVTLWLTVSFKRPAGGDLHKIQLRATDDSGNVQGWQTVGSVRVQEQDDAHDR